MPEHVSPPASGPTASSDPAPKETGRQPDELAVSEHTPAPDEDSSEAAKLERMWRITAASFLVVAIGAVAADRLHPAIGATFEAREVTPGQAITLHDARLVRPVTATASAFGLSQIRPLGPIEIPGRDGELLVRLRVAAGDCRQLVTRVGGSCAGRPQPQPMAEQLGITAPRGELETRLEMTPAGEARLGQNGGGARLRPPREWSLTENAHETTLTLRCLRPVSLTVTSLPAHAHPNCSPDGPFFELALVNHKPYAPILAFDGSRSFRTVAAASSVKMTVDSGMLSFGDVRRKVHGVEPTLVALAGNDPIEMRVASPASEGAPATMLTSGETSSATVGDEDAMPSLLARDSTAESIVYGALVTLLIGALTYYVLALMANLSKEG
jgi:hypothetical protein